MKMFEGDAKKSRRCLYGLAFALFLCGCATRIGSIEQNSQQKAEVLAQGRLLAEDLKRQVLTRSGGQGERHPPCKESMIGKWRGIMKVHTHVFSRKEVGMKFGETGKATPQIEFTILLHSDGRCEQYVGIPGDEKAPSSRLTGSWSYAEGCLSIDWTNGNSSQYSVCESEGSECLSFLVREGKDYDVRLIEKSCDKFGRIRIGSRTGLDLTISLTPPMIMTCIDSLDRLRFNRKIVLSKRRVELGRLRDAGLIDEGEYVKEMNALEEIK